MDGSLQLAMQNLEKNNIKTFFVENRADVTPLVAGLLRDGDVVTAGGSASLSETGVIDLLRNGRYNFLDRAQPGLTEDAIADIYFKAMRADAYFCSCNAITENGELYNVDGNGNRVSAIVYGPKSVVMVVGKNKVVKNLDEAVLRVKTLVAPKICSLRGRNTPCAKTGQCVSLTGGNSGMAAGCASDERACCSFLLSGRQRVPGRIKVILVNETLGY